MSQPDPLASSARPRFQLRGGAFDAGALARAEAALKSLSSQFDGWMQDEVHKLDAARVALNAEGADGEAAERLYGHAHDLKGLGGTYQFPLVTRIAGSLCRLLEPAPGRPAAPRLIDAHVDAIKAVVRDGVRTDEDPTGRSLVEALEAEVRAYMASADKGSTTAP